MFRVAVERGLTDIRQALKTEGVEVVNLDPLSHSQAELSNCDAFVISGMDRDFTGRQDQMSDGTVIDATGMTTVEVIDRVRQLQSLNSI